jgi:hypothetical protein
MLDHARVATTAAIGARAGPGHHLPASLLHHGWIALALLDQLVADLAGGSRLSLEGRDALLNSLIVNGSDGGRICDCCEAKTKFQ